MGINKADYSIIALCLSVRFTTKHVSPALQQTELQAVGKTTTTYGNMEVHVYIHGNKADLSTILIDTHNYTQLLVSPCQQTWSLLPCESESESEKVHVRTSYISSYLQYCVVYCVLYSYIYFPSSYCTCM